MNRLIFCSVLAVFCIGVMSCKNRHHKAKQNNDNEGKIVGGNETTIEAHPYQAYLLLYDGRDYYQCGGSIVNQCYIVTAARCLTRIQRIYVRIGSTNSDSGGYQYETSSFYSHPRYNSLTNDYDAGLVRIRSGMNLDGTNTKAISLVNAGYDPPESEDVILTGWGATTGDSGGPAVESSTGRLTGITSFGYGCAQPSSPGVYSLIGNREIRRFIKTITGV